MELTRGQAVTKKSNLLKICSLCLCVSVVAVLPGCGGSSQQAAEQAQMREQIKIARQQQQKTQEKRQLNDYMTPEK